MNLFTSDMGVCVLEILSDSKLQTCTVTDGHAQIQVIGKPEGCVIFRIMPTISSDYLSKALIKIQLK